MRGQRLRAVRDATHQSQSEFATKLGLSPRAYQNYERGEREMPVALFQSLVEVYKVDPVWLLAGPGPTPVYVAARRSKELELDLVESIVQLLEQELNQRREKLSPIKKGRLIRLIYEHSRDAIKIDKTYLKELVLLSV